MKRTLPFMLGTIVGSVFMLGWSALMRGEPSPRLPSTTDAEVSDLITRLSPLAKEPDGEWYRNGLTIKFSGRRSVDIELKTPDGNEYHGRAATLQEAAKRITEPSMKIRESLQGWQK